MITTGFFETVVSNWCTVGQRRVCADSQCVVNHARLRRVMNLMINTNKHLPLRVQKQHLGQEIRLILKWTQ